MSYLNGVYRAYLPGCAISCSSQGRMTVWVGVGAVRQKVEPHHHC